MNVSSLIFVVFIFIFQFSESRYIPSNILENTIETPLNSASRPTQTSKKSDVIKKVIPFPQQVSWAPTPVTSRRRNHIKYTSDTIQPLQLQIPGPMDFEYL